MNAHPHAGIDQSSNDGKPLLVDEKRARQFQKLRDRINDYLPSWAGPDHMTPTELPLVLSEAFSAAALKALPVSEPNSFAPLSIIRYADGQQMLSITGAVVKRDDEEAMRASLGLDNWPFASTDWTTIHRLVVPDLTVRERLFLERGVISKTPDELMKELGFECAGEIQVTEFLENYKSYYRFYPTLLSAEI